MKNNVLVSEFTLQEAYDNSLKGLSEVFDGEKSAAVAVELMAPYLSATNGLEMCNASQAVVLYNTISKGYELITTLHGKAVYDLNKANSKLKAIRGRYYLENFRAYVIQKKAEGIDVKDTEASREHYLNTVPEIVATKEKVDFYEAFLSTIEGWKVKLYSDMNHARNIAYSKRFTDQLSTLPS